MKTSTLGICHAQEGVYQGQGDLRLQILKKRGEKAGEMMASLVDIERTEAEKMFEYAKVARNLRSLYVVTKVTFNQSHIRSVLSDESKD